MRAPTFRILSTGIIVSLLVGIAVAADPVDPTVRFDTDLALPAMPPGAGPGNPVCINESGLLVKGCESVQARIFGTCPVGEFMVGVNTDGSVQCASLLVDCTLELICPVPATGKSCISGRLSDIKTAAPLKADMTTTESCSGGAEGGPCDLVMEIYDALAFASNPTGTPPLAFGESLVDGCGRFRFTDITPPALGFLALTVTDKFNDYELTAKFLPLAANATVEELSALAVEVATVQMWTDSAGSPFGSDTFADHGVLFSTFTKDGIPVSGVTATINGSVQAADDYYFSDGYASARTTVDVSLSSTGTNGSALIVNSDLVTHSGTGGEGDGCIWSEELADAIPDVVTVAEFTCD